MTTIKKELYNAINELPEELLGKVIDYMKYLKFSYITNNAPSELIIENEEDLMKKINEGIDDLKNGKVCPLEDTYSEIEQILSE